MAKMYKCDKCKNDYHPCSVRKCPYSKKRSLCMCVLLQESFTKMLENSNNDEVYWEHIDRVVVEKLGLPFERDYTNNGQVISESRFKLKEDKNG